MPLSSWELGRMMLFVEFIIFLLCLLVFKPIKYHLTEPLRFLNSRDAGTASMLLHIIYRDILYVSCQAFDNAKERTRNSPNSSMSCGGGQEYFGRCRLHRTEVFHPTREDYFFISIRRCIQFGNRFEPRRAWMIRELGD